MFSLAQRVLGLIGHGVALPRDAVVVDDRFIGEGYGIPTDGMREAVRMMASLEGILIDPVYTGKGLAGMIALLRDKKFEPDEDIVFVHTGGSAALFSYRWAF